MKTVTFFNIDLKVSDHTKAVKYCGSSFNVIYFNVFTSDYERSGYTLEYNKETKETTKKRIKVSYISERSRLKYGKNSVETEFLPIIKAPLFSDPYTKN